jgi:hypothetical protein
MRRSLVTASVVAGCLLLAHAMPAAADGGIRDAWLEAYPDVCPVLVAAANACFLCHSGVPDLNSYGDDLATGYPLDPIAIEATDSDGDGRTNGEEINIDCTLPGNETSPTDAASWSFIKTLFR